MSDIQGGINNAAKGECHMRIFLGYLCLICFCLLSAKAISARLHLQKADILLMKVHKLASGILVIACFLHILFVMTVLKYQSLFVIISGISTTFLIILLIYLCHMIKDQKEKMRWHRILTVFMAICIIGHFCMIKYFSML